jgi:hypothetical protein
MSNMLSRIVLGILKLEGPAVEPDFGGLQFPKCTQAVLRFITSCLFSIPKQLNSYNDKSQIISGVIFSL